MDTTQVYTNQVQYNYGTKHEQPIEIVKTNSEGKTETQKIVYPPDYGTLSSTTNGIKNLKDNNVLVPIEQYLTVNTNVISGTLTTFKPSLPVPDVVYSLETTSPIALTNFTHSNKTANAFSMDTRYVPRLNYQQYDTKGNLEVVSKSDDSKIIYLWSDNKIYPIAEVVNGEYGKVAYTSFESGLNEGNWTFAGSTSGTSIAKTGLYFYTLTPTISISKSLPAGKYILEYFAKAPVSITGSGLSVAPVSTSLADSNGWIFYKNEVTLTGPVTMILNASSGSVLIDEVRVYPLGAAMKTYTYKPLVGVASVTDINGATTFYEYDVFNRLKLVRDDRGKILKTYQYQYKNQK